ncbi:MAG: ionic transporter y4hA, partial [Nocardioides sp.]
MSRPSWTTVAPLLALVALVPAWFAHPDGIVLGALALLLVAAVLAAVHHAEVVAHRVGEPYGSLVLAVAVTIIEVGLIVTLMVTTDKDTSG